MAKNLYINCADCDTRNVAESTLAAYESITINCASVFVSPQSKELLNRYNVILNCADVRELDADVKIRTVNGKAQIKSTDPAGDRTFLSVNGKLEIGPNTQQVLSQYEGIFVNGKVLYPESVSGAVGALRVNGKTLCYPDGAIILKSGTAIDRVFTLRAKEKLYWTDGVLIFVDPKLDVNALSAKGATFAAQDVIIAESMVESLIDRIDERTEIIIVPDGTAVVDDDLTLDRTALKRYGNKLCVLGDVEVRDGDVLRQLQYLNIQGDAQVPEALHDAFLEAVTVMDGEIEVEKEGAKGRLIQDTMSLRVSKKMLEREPDGITVSDCLNLILDEDIPEELILAKLRISDCLEVRCTPDQESAVGAVSEDVMNIRTDKSGGAGMVGDIIGGALGLGDNKVINAADYVL